MQRDATGCNPILRSAGDAHRKSIIGRRMAHQGATIFFRASGLRRASLGRAV
jgi:hypothetical protein